MSAAHDYDRLRHLVDRLPPGQVGRLLRLIESDPELAAYTDDALETGEDDGVERPRDRLAIIGRADSGPSGLAELSDRNDFASVGIFDSGHGDLSERVEELVAERFNRSS